MSDNVNINITIDREIEVAASHIFATLGLDMAAAISLFLNQTVNANDLPFKLEEEQPTKRPPFQYGSMKGKIWMSDDFNEPLEDFEEYM